LRNEFTRIQIAGLETTMKAWPPIYILDELHELAAFYRTPVGAKTQREKPQMMQEANARHAPHLRDQLRQTIEASTRILSEHGYEK